MRLPTWWGLGIGVLLLCHFGTRPPRLGAEELAPDGLVVDALCQALPSRCPPGAAQPPVDDLQTRAGPLLEPTASVPLEDPLASDCWYIGLQTEWVAFKRDAGLPL